MSGHGKNSHYFHRGVIMKRYVIVLFVPLVLVFGLFVQSYALWIDNRDGTITDLDLNIMWLCDANHTQASGADVE